MDRNRHMEGRRIVLHEKYISVVLKGCKDQIGKPKGQSKGFKHMISLLCSLIDKLTSSWCCIGCTYRLNASRPQQGYIKVREDTV